MPKILRLDPDTDLSQMARAARLPFSFPVLVRPAGTHGGDDFGKIARLDDLARCLALRPDTDH